MAVRYIRESRDLSAPRSIDWAGVTLLAVGLASIMYGLTEANSRGWSDPLIVALFVLGPVLLLTFWFIELRLKFPLVDVRLFRNATFTFACVSAFLFSAAVFGSQPFTSLFMQNYLGFSPLEGGLAFLPATALVAIISPFSGVMAQKLGGRLRLVIIFGSTFVALSFVYLLRLDPDATYFNGLMPAFVLRGLGIGLVMSASPIAVLSAVPMTKSGLASGTLTMFRQTGTAVGVAVFGAIFLHHINNDLPERLPNASAAQVAQATGAAEHFVIAGDGEVRAAAEQSIVDGFVLIAEVGIAVAGVAAASAFFIRRKSAAEVVVAPAVTPRSAPSAGGGA